MKILITSFYFKPEISPRSFRTEGLVDYFLRQGAEVDLYIPDYGIDYEPVPNLNIYKVDLSFKRKQGDTSKRKRSIQDKIPSSIKPIIRYFIGTKDILFFFGLYQELIKKKTAYDGIISINLPVSVAIGTALFIRKTKQNCRTIAEYGDPYYYSTYFKRFFVHRIIEKWALKYHDFITIPTEVMLKSFLPYKSLDKIKIIPQGYNLDKEYSKNYSKGEKLKFIYGGLFYEDIRDPSAFLKMLAEDFQHIDFEFHIYTDKYMKVNNGIKLVDNFVDALGPKLVIKDFIDREMFLNTMSSFDFLVHIETRNTVPSKLIDYKLSSRPVLNIDKNNRYRNHFKEFLKGDYQNDYVKDFDIKKYDINRVGKLFHNLLNPDG